MKDNNMGITVENQGSEQINSENKSSFTVYVKSLFKNAIGYFVVSEEEQSQAGIALPKYPEENNVNQEFE